MGKSTLGEKIKRLRCERGLSCEELSNIVNVSKQTIMNWEAGKMPQKAQSMLAISKYFNVTIDDFFNDNLDIFSEEYRIKKKVEAEMGVRFSIEDTNLFLKYLEEEKSKKKIRLEDFTFSFDIIESSRDNEEQIRAEDWRYIRMIHETKEAQKREDRLIVTIAVSSVAIVWLIILSLFIYIQLATYNDGIWNVSKWFFDFDKVGILQILASYFAYVCVVMVEVLLTTNYIYRRREREAKKRNIR